MRTVFIAVVITLGALSGCSLYFDDHPTPHNTRPDAGNSNDGGNPWPTDDGGNGWPFDANDSDGGGYGTDGGSGCNNDGGSSPDGGHWPADAASWPWPADGDAH